MLFCYILKLSNFSKAFKAISHRIFQFWCTSVDFDFAGCISARLPEQEAHYAGALANGWVWQFHRLHVPLISVKDIPQPLHDCHRTLSGGAWNHRQPFLWCSHFWGFLIHFKTFNVNKRLKVQIPICIKWNFEISYKGNKYSTIISVFLIYFNCNSYFH